MYPQCNAKHLECYVEFVKYFCVSPFRDCCIHCVYIHAIFFIAEIIAQKWYMYGTYKNACIPLEYFAAMNDIEHTFICKERIIFISRQPNAKQRINRQTNFNIEIRIYIGNHNVFSVPSKKKRGWRLSCSRE